MAPICKFYVLLPAADSLVPRPHVNGARSLTDDPSSSNDHQHIYKHEQWDWQRGVSRIWTFHSLRWIYPNDNSMAPCCGRSLAPNALLRPTRRPQPHAHAIIPFVAHVAPRSFLAALLDALRARVEGTLGACLLCHLFARLLVCDGASSACIPHSTSVASRFTGSLLQLVSLVFLVLLDDLLLGLLVVDGVGAGCGELSVG